MSNQLDNFYKNQSNYYKYFLYVLSVALIVYFFPKGSKFKYEFQKGRSWQYENLMAPFDFAISKSAEEVELEKAQLREEKLPYYQYNQEVVDSVNNEFLSVIENSEQFQNLSNSEKDIVFEKGTQLLNRLYERGVVENLIVKPRIKLVKANAAEEVSGTSISTLTDALSVINQELTESSIPFATQLLDTLESIIIPNVFYDQELTENELNVALAQVSTTRGQVRSGDLIIGRGEVVEGLKLKKLNSLKAQFESDLWQGNNTYFIVFGYTLLVALVLIMLFLFLKKYRQEIFEDNNRVTFIFVNILLMVFITTLVVKTDDNYVYAVPLCILPLILKNFFDARLGLFAHVLTVLILGFIVPNSFEFILLQIIAGIVTILTISEAHKRANLFISVTQITAIYILGYFAFYIINEGGVTNIKWQNFAYFMLNGLLLLASFPLIYIYEKLFGLVSDVSLLELSDTNSKLLKELSDKAPGTFHHSLQVANLAEAAANQIGANGMLVRVGALYHDIGKMFNPTYFTENQITNINPHDDLPPKESAKIIIDHVIKGIELARKNNVPDRVIDFLRTHHGTSLVYYFYKKQKDLDGDEVDEEDFRYPGPPPFSRETAILMMADAVEAASKSLTSPNSQIIDDFVEKIVKSQMAADQFLNANITLKEIEAVKKVLKQKLINIYHLRVEYPE